MTIVLDLRFPLYRDSLSLPVSQTDIDLLLRFYTLLPYIVDGNRWKQVKTFLTRIRSLYEGKLNRPKLYRCTTNIGYYKKTPNFKWKEISYSDPIPDPLILKIFEISIKTTYLTLNSPIGRDTIFNRVKR